MRDVMLVESRPGAGDAASDALRAAGCRVHRCYASDDEAAGFPCMALTDPDRCPLAMGAEVALVVRHRIAPRAGELEHGITCALRAGLPVVEHGSDLFDPYDRWITTRSDGDVVDSCRRAVDAGQVRWRQALTRLTDVDWSIELTPERAHLVGHGPPLDPQQRNRVAVRALDIVRDSPLARPRIDVTYRADA
jgi:hypothetical protein